MKKKKIMMVLSLMIMFILALAACGSGGGDNDSDNENSGGSSSDNGKSDDGDNNDFDLVEKGKFTFAASGEFKPFSYMEGNKMVGYDIAVGKAVADKLGLEPNPKKAKFSAIVTGVQKNRYDAGVASLTINADREKHVDFSKPYYYSGPVIFTRKDSDIKSADDLKDKEISVSRGSTYVKMAGEYTDKIPQVDSDVVALQSLAKGHHDAVITDSVTGKTAIENGLDIKEVEQLDVSKQGIAVGKDHDKLLKAVDKALKELKSSGKLKEISDDEVGADITKPSEK